MPTLSFKLPKPRTATKLATALLAATMLTSPMLPFTQNAFAAPAASAVQIPASFADLVAQARPAVVSILVEKTTGPATVSSTGNNNFENLPEGMKEFLRRFGGPNGMTQPQGMPNGQARPRHLMAEGSGFFISADGYIVTNNHVIDNASDIKVRMSDGKILKGKLVGADPKTDLAVVKVKGSGFAHVAFGDSNKIRVGDWVVAMGNPYGLAGTTTAGIVSARGRNIGSGPYDDFIQIDAPINHGNSGGPTFNREGKVIGINTAIYSPSGGSIGIGFAIPSNEAKQVVKSLIADGTVHRGWLGVMVQPVTDDIRDSLGLKTDEGALVASVQPGSPAQKAGLKAGDIIRSVDGKDIKAPRVLSRVIAEKGPTADVSVKVWRDGDTKQIAVALKEMPGSKVASVKPNAETGKARIGLMLKDTQNGVTIAGVVPDSPAAMKGLQPGDVIKRINGHEVATSDDVKAAVAKSLASGKKDILMLVKTQQGNRFVAIKATKATG